MEKDKRQRSCNFTSHEEAALIQAVYERQDRIENKKINKTTLREKELAWQEILQNLLSQNITRTVEQLKTKYDNLKTLARKYAKTKDKELAKPPLKDTVILDLLFEIINNNRKISEDEEEETDSLVIVYNSEKNTSSQESSMMDNIKMEIDTEEAVYKIESENELEEDVQPSQEDENCKTLKDNQSNKMYIMSSSKLITSRISNKHETNSKQNQSTPKHVQLISNQSEILEEHSPIIEGIERLQQPQMLRRKRKLIQCQNGFKKIQIEYYKKKIELMNVEILEKQNKMKREAEEHKKKMLILDIETEQKRRSLQNVLILNYNKT